MENNNEIQIQRFKIIDPFLRKEKKLKEIEQETGISYATLKRWVNAYKKNGVLGLDKKQRADKDSYRAIDDDGVELIEQLCRESSETKISKLYSFCVEKLSNQYNISYPTFYRIVSNLDGFFNKSSNLHLQKIKKENQVYLILEIPLYILVAEEENRIVPQLLISLDAATMKPISHALNYNQSSIYTLLSFIRETILKVSVTAEKLVKPQEVLVSSENISSKKILKNIYDKTEIKLTEYFSENEEIKKFIVYLVTDIETYYHEKNNTLSYEKLKEFLDSYIYIDNPKYNFKLDSLVLDKLPYIREFDIFLQEFSRKITRGSIRVNNFVYFNEIFSGFEGKKVLIKFNPLSFENILIFFNNKFLGSIPV